jgi:hypothetical protein
LLGNGALLTGLPATYSNANVANYLPTYTGNLHSLAGNVTTTANVQANYFIGNGALLTGLPATYSNSNVANYLLTNTGNISADYYFGNGSQLTGITFTANSNITISGTVTANNFVSTGNGAVNINSSGDVSLTPASNHYVNINSLLHLTPIPTTSAPASPSIGVVYYDSTLGNIRVYTSSGWRSLVWS